MNLGKGYTFDYDPVISSDYVIFEPSENIYAVDGDVLRFNFDSTYIIAEQKPRIIFSKTLNNESITNKKNYLKICSTSLLDN